MATGPRPHDPARFAPLAVALLAGALAGVAEAAGFAWAQRQYLRSVAECLVVFGAPVALGASGAFVGTLLLRRWIAPAPVRLLVPYGVAVAAVLRWRRTDFAGSGAWLATTAVALAGALCIVAWRRPGERAAKRCVVAAGVALVAWPLGSIAALAAERDGPPPREEPSRAVAHPRVDGPPDDAPRHVVLVTWDTVRADVLPLFGGGGLDTPNLDRLAREGITFDRATAVAPITGPAHLSLLTGLYPPQHGLRSNGDPAPPATGPHLAELLRDHGFATAGFVSNLALMRRSGFDRGFDRFDDRPSAPSLARFASLARLGSIFLQRVVPAAWGALAHQTPGAVTLARAREWLAEPHELSFLWTHFYDAHAPYDPREPFAARTRARANEGLRAVDARAQADVVAQRGEVEELDSLLGELRAALEVRDPGLARTLLIVVADHGECFGEGGLRGHHQSLLHATQHVPLVLRLPSGDGRHAALAGMRVAEPVSQIDLLPTIAAALGLAPPPECEGLDLLALAAGSDAPPRGLYLEAFQHALGPRRLQGWTEAGWKYLRDREGHEQLLRLDASGHEQPVDDPARRDLLRARLDGWLATHQGASDDVPPASSSSDAEALKALGYGER